MYRILFSLTCASLLAFQIVNIGSVILFNFFHKSQTPQVAQKDSWDHELKVETFPSNEKENLTEEPTPAPQEIVAEDPASAKEVVREELRITAPQEIVAEEAIPIPPKEVVHEELILPPSTEIAFEEKDEETTPLPEPNEPLDSGEIGFPVMDSESEDLYSPSILAPMRAALRYTTPEGIGYHFGYTSLTGFFAPYRFFEETLLPFLDVRGHLFDNGKWAANGGVGVRYLHHKNVFGANIYYDFRNSSHINYNQVALGFESLGRIWDFRLNGYLPVGRTERHTSSAHTKSALKALNAEAGIHVDHFQNAPLYFSVGPYYLNGKEKSSFGGEARASVELFDRYLRLEGNSSYDTIFKWVGQAQISLQIPLSKKVCYKKDRCSRSIDLHERALQNVERHEIIPVNK